MNANRDDQGFKTNGYPRKSDDNLEVQVDNRNEILLGWVSKLEQRTRQRNILGNFQSLLRTCKTVEDLYSAVELALVDLLPDWSGSILIATDEHQKLTIRHTWGDPPEGLNPGTISECTALISGQIRYQRATTENACSAEGCSDYRGDLVCIPLRHNDKVIGLINLSMPSPARQIPPEEDLEISKYRLNLLAAVGERFSISYLNLLKSTSDLGPDIPSSYPNLLDKKMMEVTLQGEIQQAQQKLSSIGLILIKIEFPAELDAPYGPVVRQRILSEIAGRMVENIRRSDIPGWYGDDTYAIILTDASVEITRVVIERLKLEFNLLSYTDLSFSTHFAYACFPEHGTSEAELLQKSLSDLGMKP